jgi:hypothetical protein
VHLRTIIEWIPRLRRARGRRSLRAVGSAPQGGGCSPRSSGRCSNGIQVEVTFHP